MNGWNTSTGCVKMLGVENPYGNIYKWVDGIHLYKETINATRYPQQFTNYPSKYISLGFNGLKTSGYITAFKKGASAATQSYAFCSAVDPQGDGTKYCGDYKPYVDTASSQNWILYAGGNYSMDTGAGLWCLNFTIKETSQAFIGARLAFRPVNG
jgi:hypothetical protein